MRNLLLILWLAAALFLQAQDFSSITVTIGKTARPVELYYRGQLAYLSVNSLAAQFRLNHFFNPENKKIEIKGSRLAVKFTGLNPFVAFRGMDADTSFGCQLPVSTLYLNDQVFVPLTYAAAYINRCLPQPMAYTLAGRPEEEPQAPTNSNLPAAALRFKSSGKANGTLLRISSDKPVPSFTHSIKGGTVTITLEKLRLAGGAVQEEFADGLVTAARAFVKGNGIAIELTLKQGYTSYEVIKSTAGSLFVTVHNTRFAKKESGKKEKFDFDCVVIDAGHGGKDYGAIGFNNTTEKEVNLAVALKLGQLIKSSMPDVNVVYTRSDDTFVELYRRGKIANEANGKLFISIHCNSVPKKAKGPNGYEIYLLRPGRTQEAISIAERENSVISYEENPNRYEKLTDENFILVSMAHAAYMQYSEKFAELLDKHLRQQVPIEPRGIKQAGFLVLVGASMPGILFETGYVTNEDDSAFLRSKDGQQQLAQALYNAVKSFRTYYEQVTELD